MKYVSHIKEIVSGILDNETVTRYPEAYDALTALYNHLDTLEEVHKYLPYKDPGPVIQKLEQALANRNTDIQNLKAQLKDTEAQLQEKTKSRDQCYKYWQEYKSKNETLVQENKDLRIELDDRKLECEELARSDHKAAQQTKEIQDLQAQIQELEQRNKNQQEIIHNLKSHSSESLTVYQKEIERLTQENQNLKQKNQELTASEVTQASKHKQEIDDIIEQNEKYYDRNNNLFTIIQNLESKLTPIQLEEYHHWFETQNFDNLGRPLQTKKKHKIK